MSLDAPEYPQVPGLPPAGARRPQRLHPARHDEVRHQRADRPGERTARRRPKEGAPHLTREESARLLGASQEELEAAALEKATEPTRQLPSGLTLAQAAALHQAMTSDRTGYATVGPAGTGKSHVAAKAARCGAEG